MIITMIVCNRLTRNILITICVLSTISSIYFNSKLLEMQDATYVTVKSDTMLQHDVQQDILVNTVYDGKVEEFSLEADEEHENEKQERSNIVTSQEDQQQSMNMVVDTSHKDTVEFQSDKISDNRSDFKYGETIIEQETNQNIMTIQNIERDGTPLEIREWGCNRTETPLIFIHIGKAGGGNIRARFAASALDYNKGSKWFLDDNSFYPVAQDKQAKFCNSGHANFRKDRTTKTFEGTHACRVKTPLGLIACPDLDYHKCILSKCHKFTHDECLQVYVGHNFLGSEMHWLPFQMIDKWWNSTEWSQMDTEFELSTNNITNIQNETLTEQLLTSLLNINPECPPFQSYTSAGYDYFYEKCFKYLPGYLDRKAMRLTDKNEYKESGYSSFYQSLPVLRTVVLREPFSWMLSKFFWHREDNISFNCTNLDQIKWAESYALTYINYLCGEDCAILSERHMVDLDRFEKQASANLRKAFAVVGLLHDTQSFYDMVTKRVKYVDMSLNPFVTGDAHKTMESKEKMRCSSHFQDLEFQKRMIDASPVIAALVKLYDVGVEVNKFQMKELETC